MALAVTAGETLGAGRMWMQFSIQLYSLGGAWRKSSTSQAVFSNCSDGEVAVEGSRVK